VTDDELISPPAAWLELPSTVSLRRRTSEAACLHSSRYARSFWFLRLDPYGALATIF
jgi:hypothetical protein